MKSKFWNYVLYNYLRKIKSKAFIGFNIFLIIIGFLVSQLGNIMSFFNDTFDYSQTIYVVDETNQTFIHNLKKILIVFSQMSYLNKVQIQQMNLTNSSKITTYRLTSLSIMMKRTYYLPHMLPMISPTIHSIPLVNKFYQGITQKLQWKLPV